MIVLLCAGHAAHHGVPGAGLYLKDFDFEAAFDERAEPGTGRPTWTSDLEEAMRFADMAEMHAFYVRIPAGYPLRWDGQPNRPMTGYTWRIVNVDPA